MNRIAPSRAGTYAFLIVLGLCPFPREAAARAAASSPLSLAPISLPAINVNGPANLGGARSFQAPILPAIVIAPAPSLQIPSISAAAVSPILPAQAHLVDFAAQLSGAQGAAPSAAELREASGKAFDGSLNKQAASLGGEGAIGSGSGSTGGGSGKIAAEGLGRLYPRVVMILDPLESEATERTIKYMETLADRGVRVIFVTPRPEKGDNSAESVIVSRLKVRMTKFPMIVVSFNGARIAARNSRAENPKPLVDDEAGFPEKTLAAFRKIAANVKSNLDGKGEMPEFSVGGEQGAYIYGADLPKGVEPEAFVKEFNRSLRHVGLKYKIETGERPDGTRFYYTQSTALRLNTTRIFNALYAQYPELKGELAPEQVLILADARKTTKFLNSLPGKGYYIHGVQDGDSLETALSAVLGNQGLDKVSVMRSQLRSYSDWLDARAKYGPSSKSSGSGSGGGGYNQSKGNSAAYRDLGFYRGILMYDLMGRLYHSMRKGQYMDASPEAAEELLTRMWYNPRANGVRISLELDAARQTGRWTALHRGYLETSKVWLRNYYKRNFKNFPEGVSERVVGTMINLARDSKNTISVEYASPYTGRRYMVHVLPARAHLERDDKGNILVADVYRTGKEPYESEFEDSVETSLLARAVLQGYADLREDGKWYVNDEANPRVKVRFHYMTRDLSVVQTPEEIEARSADVTAMIEKMKSDTEFLAHWAEQEAKNSKLAPEPKKRGPKIVKKRAPKIVKKP